MEQETGLGKLESVHGPSIAFTQRTFIVAAVSFVFFLAMLIAFTIRQNIGYFLLGTAFLIVEIFTLAGWYFGRKRELRIYENGFSFKDKPVRWDEIYYLDIAQNGERQGCAVGLSAGKEILLNDSIQGIGTVIDILRSKTKDGQPQPHSENQGETK